MRLQRKCERVSESETQVPVRAEEMKRSLRPEEVKTESGERDGRRSESKVCKCEVQAEYEKAKRGRKPERLKGLREKAAAGRKEPAGIAKC